MLRCARFSRSNNNDSKKISKKKKAQNEKVGLPPLYEFDTFCRFVLVFMMAIAFVVSTFPIFLSCESANNRFPVCCPILPSCQLSTLLPTLRNRVRTSIVSRDVFFYRTLPYSSIKFVRKGALYF